jgi:hypothetical protein
MAKVYKCMNNPEHLFQNPTPDFYCDICPPYSAMLVLSEMDLEVNAPELVMMAEEKVNKPLTIDLKKYFPPIQGFKYGERMKDSELNAMKLYLSQFYTNEYREIESLDVMLYYDNSYKLGEKSGILLMQNQVGDLHFLIFDNKLGLLLFNLNSKNPNESLKEISFHKGILQLNYTQSGKEKSKTFAGFQKLVSESLISFVNGYGEE